MPEVVPGSGVPQLPAYLLPNAPLLNLPLVPITFALAVSCGAGNMILPFQETPIQLIIVQLYTPRKADTSGKCNLQHWQQPCTAL